MQLELLFEDLKKLREDVQAQKLAEAGFKSLSET